MNRIAILGKGFIAGKFSSWLRNLPEAEHCEVFMPDLDITESAQVQKMMRECAPDIVINCAGRTGRPNIDWCEAPQNKGPTWASNVLGPLVVGRHCLEHNVFLVHIGSGCIYEGDNGGKGFSEDDPPNFRGSFYSCTKIEAEQSLEFLRKSAGLRVLQLRLRMPLDSALHERNLITKVTSYPQVISVPNSISVLDDFLAAAWALIQHRQTGIFNAVNPGSMTHEEMLELYKKWVDPLHTYQLISIAELEEKTAARRSNCVLSTQKIELALESMGVKMRNVHEAVEDSLKQYRTHA